jgi:hypothetical protein
MCKGCEMTDRIAELYRQHGLFVPEGNGDRTSPLIEDFDAAINALIQVLSFIAAERARPEAFLRDVHKRLNEKTKLRMRARGGLPGATSRLGAKLR